MTPERPMMMCPWCKSLGSLTRGDVSALLNDGNFLIECSICLKLVRVSVVIERVVQADVKFDGDLGEVI